MTEETVINPPCPRCQSKRTARVKRTGLLQRFVYYRFGLYPWECSNCRNNFLFKSRGKLKRRRRTTGEVHLPPV
jgi:DNA-directed RNA polymerase subunit RPC12/RpoP